jgi:hypothetical protein
MDGGDPGPDLAGIIEITDWFGERGSTLSSPAGVAARSAGLLWAGLLWAGSARSTWPISLIWKPTSSSRGVGTVPVGRYPRGSPMVDREQGAGEARHD